MDSIIKYFPAITDEQRHQYEQLFELYKDWNSKINVISRKDIDNLYEHHVLHSLAIAKALRFKDGTKIKILAVAADFLAFLLPLCSQNVSSNSLMVLAKRYAFAKR